MTDDARLPLGPKTAATKMTSLPDGTYFMYVRFERNLQEDIQHRVAQDALTNGASGDEALTEQFRVELGDLSNEGPSAWEIVQGPTSLKDPGAAFAVDDDHRKGNPWELSQFLKASQQVAARFRRAMDALGAPLDPELSALVDRVQHTGFDDLVGRDAQVYLDRAEEAERKRDEVVEKVRTAYSTAQSVVSEIEDALPEWAKEGMRGRR